MHRSNSILEEDKLPALSKLTPEQLKEVALKEKDIAIYIFAHPDAFPALFKDKPPNTLLQAILDKYKDIQTIYSSFLGFFKVPTMNNRVDEEELLTQDMSSSASEDNSPKI